MLAFELNLIVARGFFSREGQQIDFLAHLVLRHRVQPAREQNFIDQAVQLSDVLLQAGFGFRIGGLLQHFHRQPNTRQRRPQFMRGIGQQRPIRADELLNLGRCPIEALRQAGDFIVAFDRDARAEIAGAERVDAALQPIETSADLPNDGKGSEAYR